VLIVLGNRTLATYPEGGGVWSWFLQYAFGLRDLGHRVFWIELLKASGDSGRDRRLIRQFFDRARRYGLDESCALMVLGDLDAQDPERGETLGKSWREVAEIARSADLLWNLACSIREPLLSMFRRKALIDVDPGHLQVSALSWDLGIGRHDVFLTPGTKINDRDCEIPKLGVTWHPFFPFVHLPAWPYTRDPGPRAPFTSITQWSWEELMLNGRVLSLSKRSAYLPYAELPRMTSRPFELAANLGEKDPANDRETLCSSGWRIVAPHEVAATPEAYADYIQSSRAEIQCPKPIFRELKTGWFSDRSVCYLASGRPVIAEETGFSERIPTGKGLIAFRNIDEAAAAVAEIDSNYDLHSRAARELADELFDSRRCLSTMLQACA
jgi:glycosyltransferase involved in cell wall biosynthesis